MNDASVPDPHAARPAPAHCANCGTPLVGRYCHACGQSTETVTRFIGSVVSDLLGSLFNYDSRALRTLLPLLFRPGHVCSEFLAGRRAHFLPPFRLYLFASVLFFLVIKIIHVPTNEAPIQINSQQHPVQASEGMGVRVVPLNEGPEAGDEAHIELPFISPERNAEIGQRLDEILRHRPMELVRAIENNLPTTMFFLLPVLALVLKLLYAFSGRYYLEHLIYVLYSQSFVFFFLLIALVFKAGTGMLAEAHPSWVLLSTMGHTIVIACYWWILIYLLLMQRRVYGQGWIMTTFKFGIAALAYAILIGLTLAAAAVMSIVNL